MKENNLTPCLCDEKPPESHWFAFGRFVKQLYLLRNGECGLVALLNNRCVILFLGIIVFPAIIVSIKRSPPYMSHYF